MDQTAAPGLVLAPTATVGHDVRFGAHVVVHDGVVIGDGVVIQDARVLGKPPALRAGVGRAGAAPRAARDRRRRAICAAAIVFAGAPDRRAARSSATRRTCASARVGARHAWSAAASTVDNDVIVGARVRIQTNVYLTAFSVIEDDVFVGPCAMTTNDDTMGRTAPATTLRGATLRRACRIGGGAVLLPGVEVGEEAFVAAGAVVTARRSRRARS